MKSLIFNRKRFTCEISISQVPRFLIGKTNYKKSRVFFEKKLKNVYGDKKA